MIGPPSDAYPLPTRGEQPEPDNVPPGIWPEDNPHFMLGRAASIIEDLLIRPGDVIAEGMARDWLKDYKHYIEDDGDV